MTQQRNAIKKMDPYDPPTSSRKGKLRLDFNENTLGPSPKVLEKLKNLDQEELAVYPEYNELREQLAEYLRLNKEQVIPTNGTDEAILVVMASFIEKGDEIILPVPTFAMFKFYASIFEAAIKPVLYNEDLSFPTENVLKNINDQTKMVVLVSPNNPTGSAVSEQDTLAILEKAKKNNALVVIDEAYYQFMGRSSKDLINDYDNLIVLQTFSKAMGLAGIRLGYAMSNPGIIKILSKVISPYSVNSLAVICAFEAMKDMDFVEAYVKEVKQSKKIVYDEFEKLGIKTFPTEANFFIANFGEFCNEVWENLRKRNIIVRNRTKYPLLKNCLRIGIGNLKQTEYFLKNLNEVLAEVGWKRANIGVGGKKALLFDMDGVLVDVSQSYRIAIQKTVESFSGKQILPELIQEYKNKGGLNNDWDCTEAILKDLGCVIEKQKIIDKFQEFYLGKRIDNSDGLICQEKWLLDSTFLYQLSQTYKLGIMTGRPRQEAMIALEKAGAKNFFEVVIAMEDVPEGKGKPDPFGLQLCLNKLGCKKGYYLGDVGDDMTAAKAANLRGVGVLPPQDKSEDLKKLLQEKGAVEVIKTTNDVMNILDIMEKQK